MTDANRQINEACLALERYRLATYANVEFSAHFRTEGVLHIKPMGECDIQTVHLGSGANIHAELYARFRSVGSVLLVKPEWIGIASDAGWTLERSTYGYIPSFSDTVPCTERVRTPVDSTDYPKALCDAIESVLTVNKLPCAVLVRSRGAVILANSPMEAAEYAITLEYAAKKAFHIRKLR